MGKRLGSACRFLFVVAALGLLSCSTADVKMEAVASANGEEIKVMELREFLGVRGGSVEASEVPIERKKEGLNRLIAGRLLAQDARAKGLDNTSDFRNVVMQNEKAVLITALFRREVANKVKVSKEDVNAEAGKMRTADNNLSEENARAQARRSVSESKLRAVEEELIALARKEFPATIRQEEMDRINRGETVSGDTVLATAAGDNVTFGDVRKVLLNMEGGMHGSQDLTRNPVAVGRMLDREVTGLSLAAYAKKEGIERTEWAKTVREDMERSILIDMLAEKEILPKAGVTDQEVKNAYEEHGEMFMNQGKKIPLPQVREQLRGFLQNEKKRKALEAYIDDLKKKAKITVNESLLPKV